MVSKVLAFCLALLIAAPALAAQQCTSRADLLPQITVKHGQAKRMIGIAGNIVIEHWLNAESGMWTITATNAEGVMCVLAVGFSGEMIKPEAPSEGA